jgi:MFS family permease
MPLLQYLIRTMGWRGAYLVLGMVTLIVPPALIWLFVHTRPEDRGLSADMEMQRRRKRKPVEVEIEREDGVLERKKGFVRKGEVVILDSEWAETEWTVKKAVKSFRFWALTLVVAMFAAGFFLISVQLVAYLEDKGYSPIMAASVVGLQGLLNIGGKFLGGILSDRIGREKTLTLSIIIFVAGIAVLNLGGFFVNAFVIYTFAVLYGVGYGLSLPALMASAADLFQGKHFGSILGIIILGGFIGGALGTWLGGVFFDQTGAYRVNFLVAAFVMFVSGALIWKARPGRVRIVSTVEPKDTESVAEGTV